MLLMQIKVSRIIVPYLCAFNLIYYIYMLFNIDYFIAAPCIARLQRNYCCSVDKLSKKN
jgi:hypothetical protein